MQFNIFTGNHGKLSGIEDFISILQNVIQKRGYYVEVSEKLNPDCINMIIDEFTNSYTNHLIVEFKNEHPKSLLIFVLTEFSEKKWLVRSFNFFGSLLDASVISLLNVYVRFCREDFNKPSIRDWILGIIYFPIFIVFYLINFRVRSIIALKNNKSLNFQDVIHSKAYMLMRYMGLERMLNYADGVLISHNLINLDSKKVPIGVIYPELDYDDIQNNLFNQKVLGLEVTGSITPYRHKAICKVNAKIMQLGLKKYFNLCQIIAFSKSKSNEPRAAFSIHPPQTHNWKYSSPTRIFRALQFDHNIPVLIKLFGQHPIEKLCLIFSSSTLIEMIKYYENKQLAVDFLQPRVEEYNQVAKLENDKNIKIIIELAKQRLVK